MLLLPVMLFLSVVFLYPTALLLFRSISYPDWGLQNFQAILDRPLYFRVMRNTFLISFTVTAICLLLGYPTAYVMARSGSRMQTLILFAVLIPFWTSLLVRTYAWLVLLQRTGLVNDVLIRLNVIEEPLALIHNRLGVLIGMAQILLPFMILPLFATMSQIDKRYVQAANSLGATPSRTFLRIFLPLSMPGIMAGSAIVFILSLGYYITPALLGGPQDMMVAMLIEQQIGEFGNWGIGAALAVILLGVTLLLLTLLNRIVRLDKGWGV